MPSIDAIAALGSSLGTNVLMQLRIVAPEFFERDYIAARLVPSPSAQPSGSFVIPLEPLVVASTHPLYRPGSRVALDEHLAELTAAGYCVAISPAEQRRDRVSEEILRQGPYDRVVAAEIAGGDGFGKPRVFYSHGSPLPGGRTPTRTLEREQYVASVSSMHTHFVFFPQGEAPRKPRFIGDSWKLRP